MDCYTDGERDEHAILSSFSSYEKDWTEEATRQLIAQCADRSGGQDVLPHVGTRDVVRDAQVRVLPAVG